MDGIRPPGAISFEGDNVADACEKFYQQFEWYLYAIKADNEPDMREISLFLTRSSISIWNIYIWN